MCSEVGFGVRQIELSAKQHAVDDRKEGTEDGEHAVEDRCVEMCFKEETFVAFRRKHQATSDEVSEGAGPHTRFKRAVRSLPPSGRSS